MEQYRLELSAQGRENIEETVAVLMEAAQEIANASEQDFEHMKSKKWYKRLWEMITYSRDNEKITARGVQNLAKLNEIVMKAVVLLARYSAETAALVSESLNKIENLENCLGSVTGGLTKVAAEVKKLKYNYKKSLSFEDLNTHERDIVGSIFAKYARQCAENGIMPNAASQKLYAFAMSGDTPEEDIDVTTHLDLISGEVQQLLYRLEQSYYYLIEGEFDESEYFDDFDISNKNMRIIRQQIADAVLFSGAENYTDIFTVDNSLCDIELDGVEIDTAATAAEEVTVNPDEERATELCRQGDEYFAEVCSYDSFDFSSYEKSEAAEKNAFNCYKEAAELGSAEGRCKLAICYLERIGIGYSKSNHNEAYFLLKKAAEQGYAEAQHRLGDQLCHDNNYKEAVEYFRKAAEQGHINALLSLAKCYSYGDGVDEDEQEAFICYREAAELGSAQAYYKLGWIYQNGDYYYSDSPEEDMEAGLECYRKAAEMGNTDALTTLCGGYHESPLEPDSDKLRKWNQMLSDMGWYQNRHGAWFDPPDNEKEKPNTIYERYPAFY